MKMQKKIRKAVFPVGGLGTRFLPATKAMPKEMLPVIDKPLIQYAVEEAIEAGIEHFIFVTGHGKTSIENHFDAAPTLEKLLEQEQKFDLLEMLQKSTLQPGKISYIRQSEPLGLGHAVWCAKDLVEDEPFAVLLPDDIFYCKTACLKQLVDIYNERGGNVVAINDVPMEQTVHYGVLSVEQDDGRIIKANGLVEKPKLGTAPSCSTISGRYVLSHEVMEELGKGHIGAKGEIQLTDAISATFDRVPFYGVRYDGERFDCGNKVGFLLANVKYALDREDLKDDFLKGMENLGFRIN